MSKKLIITICTVVVLCIVGLMAFMFSSKDAPTTPVQKEPAATSPAVVDPHISNPQQHVKDAEPSETAKVDPKTPTTPIVDAESLEPVEGFTDKEIKESVQFVSDFAYASLTDRYFIGGHFSDDEWPTEKVQDFSGQFFSKKLVDDLAVIEDLKKQGKGDEYRNKVFPYVFFMGDNGLNRPADECRMDTVAEEDLTAEKEISTSGDGCIISPLKFSNVDYYVVDVDGKNRLVYNFDVTFDMRLTDNETNDDLATTVKYNYFLTLAPTVDPVTEEFTYEIDNYDTNFSVSKTREIPQSGGAE